MCLLLVEPLDRTAGAASLHVGVCSLPSVEGHAGRWELVQGVLGLGLSGDEGLVVVVVCCLSLGLLLSFWGGGGLGVLLLLGGRGELEGLVDEVKRQEDVLCAGLVGNRVEVAEDVGELGSLLSSEEEGASPSNVSGDRKIGEGDSLSDEEGASGKVVFKKLQTLVGAFNEEGLELKRDMSMNRGRGKSRGENSRACCRAG